MPCCSARHPSRVCRVTSRTRWWGAGEGSTTTLPKRRRDWPPSPSLRGCCSDRASLGSEWRGRTCVVRLHRLGCPEARGAAYCRGTVVWWFPSARTGRGRRTVLGRRPTCPRLGQVPVATCPAAVRGSSEGGTSLRCWWRPMEAPRRARWVRLPWLVKARRASVREAWASPAPGAEPQVQPPGHRSCAACACASRSVDLGVLTSGVDVGAVLR